MHAYYVPLRAEELPDDPPVPFERQVADWRNIREDESVLRWLLRVDGEIAAVAVAFVNFEQNLDNAFARIHVRPDLRGRGLGGRLARPVLDSLAEDGRTRLSSYIVQGTPEAALLRQLGLKPVYREKCSRLIVADVDMDLMSSWIQRAAERASDYELIYLEMPFPDDVVEKYCELQFQMNTAPREDFEEDDEVITPEIWRDTEEKMTSSFNELHTHVAVHKPTGDFVGSTTINTDRLQPEQAWQWETVVHPDHRNKGLSRCSRRPISSKSSKNVPKQTASTPGTPVPTSPCSTSTLRWGSSRSSSPMPGRETWRPPGSGWQTAIANRCPRVGLRRECGHPSPFEEHLSRHPRG